ncbi:TraR/DksA family transcriptional regulator [Vibrio parahaemolyticus]|nr:TraR/DksA family transcriptional regulator [Vibrio parahaemolyticus]
MDAKLSDEDKQQLIEESKQRLIEQHNKGESRIAEIDVEMDALSSEQVVEAIDRTQQETSLNILRVEKNRINRQSDCIRNALKAIREGDYGWCEDCGQEIEQERLEKRPESLVCVHCQEVRERNEKLFDQSSN